MVSVGKLVRCNIGRRQEAGNPGEVVIQQRRELFVRIRLQMFIKLPKSM